MRALRLSLSVLASAVALALPAAVRAESLLELYQAARGYDATWLAARARAESAQYQVEQVNALNRPVVGVNAAVTGSQVDPPFYDKGTNNSGGASLDGRYPLFNRANAVQIEQARRTLDSARAELDAAEQDLIVRLAQAYFDVLAAEDALATTRASKTAITEQLASARRNFEVGTATITDTREAQARFDLATAEEIAAENTLRTRRVALDTLVGRIDVRPDPLKAPVVLPSPTPANPEEWVSLADRDHPSVRRARVALDVATLEIDRARAGYMPTVDVVASLGARRTGGSSPAVSLPGNTRSASLGLELAWPLYTGGSTQNRVRETLLLEEGARNEFEAARRGVAQNTRTAWFGVQSGLAQVKALEAAESSSQLALEATQLGYRVGVRVNLDVLDAQTQLYTTRRDLARARYDVIVNTLRLQQAAGQLGADDVEAVNALLAR